ncbi:sn-glycerol 3-phosphate transport system permease protein [Clostridium acetobutylicum]|uniref:Glycerol-3-phosphate ABC-transporter, permease component n=1 Tax=Clostridium acetobutylicum (strain ATCC 824 / DSM 792 / JCM 1419 / IAM 19013 / LMG 5710 / NBRC 13948 / NRRL B-527 / VKM B-1787 / 2291 / W) TaxID=272562 RepID=Q97LX7_CLOAB|nr:MULTISPECIES: sugar ABC transporter permease [Clostridium]AAK78407.1 Glycerol-3-phosphate ABC-transporter, permease component [Clostridium acetobutylicum ATCC 824]ADZ19477.1 Glycerol-3-phosphate ABC-transporter, permease component [Clostridium acetobutylicum EA 2018]AEI33969.1 glycerol-3-phosphate ABC-transporter, permease component [Clostridium acetobutylicum DSM 1731]AWV80130.1 sugar ABC transporter permease [Clostridium acetobutylicum]MBC2392310.1 sugar ABC transporter permease [Clostrid
MQRVQKQVLKRERILGNKFSLTSGKEAFLYMLPCLIIFLAFTYYPFFKTIYLSFFNMNAEGKIAGFAGISNYLNLIKSESFLNTLVVTFKFVLMTVVPSIFIGLLMALITNNKLKFKGLFTTMYAMPMAVSSSSAAIIWLLLFNPSIGMINYLLRLKINWFTSSAWGIVALTIVNVWLNAGVNYIFINAGLKNIPKELYESAYVDGAGYFTILKKIIIPCLSPTLFFVTVITVINTFQTFGTVNIMTSGGPSESTNLIVFSIYRNAFFNNKLGTASAESVILFLIMLAVTLFQFKYEKSKVFYN